MLTVIILFGTALAQEPVEGEAYSQINAQAFRPSIDSQHFFWLTDSTLTEQQEGFFRTVFSYTKDPLTYVDYQGNKIPILSDVSSLNMMAGVAYNNFRIGIDLPVFFGVVGTTSEQTALMSTDGSQDLSTGTVGIGDTVLDYKFRLVDHRTSSFGAQFSARTSLPSNTTNLSTGTDGVTYELETGLDKTMGGLTLAAAVGHRGIPEVELDNATWGSQFYTRAGGAVQYNGQAGTAIEYIGARTYSSGNSATRPKELLFSGWKRVGEAGVNLRGGWGVGLNNAISVPKYRILFSIGVEPPENRDTDQDGIFDNKDSCINNPEDIDGISDNDGCPEPTPVTVVIVNQFGDQIETATWTNGTQSGKSQDSYETFASDGPVEFVAKANDHQEASVSLAIPDAEQFRVKIELSAILGQLTVLTIDSEGNAIANSRWSIQEQKRYQNLRSDRSTAVVPGQWLIVATADGYKPTRKKVVVEKEQQTEIVLELTKAKAQITGNKIEISEEVHFESGSDIILEKSFGLLDEIADLLLSQTEPVQLKIEGHTDSRGNDTMNKDLSQKRADAVKVYLEAKGLNPDAMEAIGFGETQPIASNDTADGRAANRRVVFHIYRKTVE